VFGLSSFVLVLEAYRGRFRHVSRSFRYVLRSCYGRFAIVLKWFVIVLGACRDRVDTFCDRFRSVP